MTNWKKAGLTALASSLVATSAFAGAMSVSGTANLTYTANTGQEDTQAADETAVGVDGSRWGLNKSLSFSGSGELDNGWTVSVSNTLANGSSSGIGMTIDMNDMGSLNYEASTGARGIGKIKDMMPTADEDVGNGIDVDGSGTAGGLSGTVSGGTQGFHYANTMGDSVEFGFGYAPKSQAGGAQGGVSGAGAGESNVSGFIKLKELGIDGLEVGLGVGESNSAADGQTDDNTTMYATYVWGNFTFGVQMSEVETSGATADDEQTRWGVLYAVNDEISISYQNHENDDSSSGSDEEASGISASYTSGGITYKIHRNTADNVSNATSNESEHTEIGVTFAF